MSSSPTGRTLTASRSGVTSQRKGSYGGNVREG
jgi:hypothetical protein